LLPTVWKLMSYVPLESHSAGSYRAGRIPGLLYRSYASGIHQVDKKACTYCHVDATKAPKDLKDAGKYYQEHKSLEGYVIRSNCVDGGGVESL